MINKLYNYALTIGIKRLVVIILVFTFSLYMVLLTIRYLNTGTLKISSNVPNVSVNIIKISNDEVVKSINTGEQKTITTKLKPGDYQIIGSSGSNSITQKVTIKLMKSTDATFEFKDNVIVKNIIPTELLDMSADENQIYYLSNDMGVLKKIDEYGNTKIINDNYLFKKIHWTGFAKGYGLSKGGEIIKIDKESLSPIYTPEHQGFINEVTFMPTKNDSVYYSDSYDIYELKNNEAKVIYTGSQERLNVLNNMHQLSFSSVEREENHVSDYSESHPEYEMTLLVQQEEQKYKDKIINGLSYKWSKDGNTVAVLSNDQINIYNKNLEQLLVQKITNALEIEWYDDENLLYVVDNKIYKLNIKTNLSNLITSSGATGRLLYLYPFSNIGTIYLNAKQSLDNAQTITQAIYLDSTWMPENEILVTTFLPKDFTTCISSYINFKKLVILTKEKFPGRDCVEETKNYLIKNLVDVSELEIIKTNDL